MSNKVLLEQNRRQDALPCSICKRVILAKVIECVSLRDENKTAGSGPARYGTVHLVPFLK